MLPSNITTERTPYPVPEYWYGPGKYWKQEKAEHAHRAYHTPRGEAIDPKPDTVPISYAGRRWRAADGEKICAACGRGFEPGPRPTQVTCSSECSRKRKNEMTRINSAQRKAVK